MKIRIIALFFVVLTAVGLVVPVYARPSTQRDGSSAELQSHIEEIKRENPSFSENFRKENDQWYTGEDKDSAHFFKNGAYHIRVDSKSLLSWTLAKTEDGKTDFNASDFYLEVDSFQIAGPLENEIGVLFRHVDDDNYYLLGVGDDGLYALRKKVDGEWTTLIDWVEASPIVTGKGAANTLGILAEGAQISVLVNGEILATVEDDTFSTGGIGLGAAAFDKGGVEIAFDDFHLWNIGETKPVSSPTTTPTATDASSRIEEIKATDSTYSDDFSTNQDEWGLKSTKDSTFSYTGSALHIRVKSKNWLTWSTNSAIGQESPSDFLLEADVAHVAGPQDAEMGLIFRYVDADNFYAFFINQKGGYSLWKQVDGKFEALVDWTDADVLNTGTKSTNRLGVLAEGTQITLLVNDTILTQVEDDAFREGNVAVVVSTFDKAPLEAAFDNLDFWNIGSTTEPTETPTAIKTPIEIGGRLDEIKAADPIYSEDFHHDDQSWSTNSDKDATYAYTRSALHIQVKTPNWSGWSINETSGADFLLEADAVHVAGPADVEYGVAFRYVNGDNFYLFVISQTGSYSLWKKVDNEWQNIIDWTTSDEIKTEDKAVNHLGILAQATEITLLINDVAVAQANDDQFHKGSIALMLGTFDEGNAEVAFDNVNMWDAELKPGVAHTAEATGTPEITETAEATDTPEATETPEVNKTAEATDTTEATETPEATAATKATNTPEATETLEATVEPRETLTSTTDVPGVATIKSSAPLFSDDFRRDSQQWNLDSGQDDVTFAYSQRAFYIKVDAPQTFTWSTGDVTATNFLLELDTQFVTGSLDVQAGLIFGLVDENNYHLFAIKKSGEYALLKKVDGAWETIVDWTESTAIDTREKGVNHLGVLAANSELTLLINDVVLPSTPDETFGTGQIGLAVGTGDQPGAEVAFDNVKLWAVE